jgi:hypothetical protein
VSRGTVLRAGVVTAVIGGGLRAAASFAPTFITSVVVRESLYVIVDVCLGMSLASFFRSEH